MYFPSIVGPLGLLAQNPVPINTQFTVGGFYKAGDGGGGTFIWIPATTLPVQDRGVIFYANNNTSGYFQRVFSGPVNVRWFGAIYDMTLRPDVTVYVHRAIQSKTFAANGTLYFPKGEYPGAFVLTPAFAPPFLKDEINIVGDGQGTVLRSAGKKRYPSAAYGLPVLTLGAREQHWRWAKVSNLTINGTALNIGKRFCDGVEYSNSAYPNTQTAGRWVFDRVYFLDCNRGVYKPKGNIGNHYIDCTWQNNNYGVYAIGDPGRMHNGSDRYSGGHFSGSDVACLYYEDTNGGGGQLIFDGTIIEQNNGWAYYIKCSNGARMSMNAICIRNVWFEANGKDGVSGDMYFEGIRSVRIDDGRFSKLTLIDSSVNLFNCAYHQGEGSILVDSRSSLVAYEQRCFLMPSNKIFVISISYDAVNEIGQEGSGPNDPFSKPAPWVPTSVWGPLRAVSSTNRGEIVVSTHFDNGGETWYVPGNPDVNSHLSTDMRVLGKGSNWFYVHNWDEFSSKPMGQINGGKFYVWSIHTFTEYDLGDGELVGKISAPGSGVEFGYVYFKTNQWVCSYGMKYIEVQYATDIFLSFIVSHFEGYFFITDFQIVAFDDLASATSFVNSREFAVH